MRHKSKLLPIVAISFQDHSCHHEGVAGPVMFLAIGIVQKEDDMGYYITHWLRTGDSDGDSGPEITSYVAKVKGLKIKTIGHFDPEAT